MPDRPNPPIDPEAAPTEEELAEAESLRAALDQGTAGAAPVELARALRAAWSPSDLAPAVHARVMDQALARFDRRKARRRAWAMAGGAGVALALAAGVVAIVWPLSASSPVTSAALVPSRSTQPLFDERFPPTGGEGARVERIAAARAADFRQNRFARWGLR